MGTLLHRCVKVRRAIELSCGVVSGVGPGIHVLDGSPLASRGRGCFWHGFRRFAKFSSNTLQWRHTDTYSCVKNRQYFCTHSTPLNSASNSLAYGIVRFKIEVDVDAKFTCKTYQNKCNTPTTQLAMRGGHVLAST